MDMMGYHTKIIELAYNLAANGAKDQAEVLRRFRVAYRHMAASVDSVMVELGQGPFGPMEWWNAGCGTDARREQTTGRHREKSGITVGLPT